MDEATKNLIGRGLTLVGQFLEKKPSEQALLMEYQVCEQDNAANFQGFWTLAAIFLGLSSAFLAGLIYAVVANKSLLGILLYSHNERSEALAIGIIALVIGIANVIILKKLEGWHKRILFNQGVNSGRMREIELQLGTMGREWRRYAIDKWNGISRDKRAKATCTPQQWSILGKKLKCGIALKYRQKLDEHKEDILELINQYFENGKVKERKSKYVPSSSTKYFPCILCTLISLWVLVIGSAVFLIVSPNCGWQGLVVAGIILAAYFVCICACRIIRKYRSKS